MDDLDRLTDAFMDDPEFFKKLIKENRMADALEIMYAMTGVKTNEQEI